MRRRQFHLNVQAELFLEHLDVDGSVYHVFVKRTQAWWYIHWCRSPRRGNRRSTKVVYVACLPSLSTMLSFINWKTSIDGFYLR